MSRRERDDYQPDRPVKKKGGLPLWAILAIAIGGPLVLGVGCLGTIVFFWSSKAPSSNNTASNDQNLSKEISGREHKFGERIRSGDLLVTIVEVDSSTTCAGERYGEYRVCRLMYFKVSIENSSKGKIADWSGWQGKASVEDEHGNKFNSANLAGWSFLPHNNTLGDGWNGDFRARIPPGTTYVLPRMGSADFKRSPDLCSSKR